MAFPASMKGALNIFPVPTFLKNIHCSLYYVLVYAKWRLVLG